MSAKSVFSSVLLVVLLGSGAAHGQMAYPVASGMPGGQMSYPAQNPGNQMSYPVQNPGGQIAYPVPNAVSGGPPMAGPMNPLDGLPGQVNGGDPSLKPPTPQPPGSLSPWIIGTQPICCHDPIGGDGPIHEELFTRVGVSLPFGDGVFGKTLQMGYSLEAGGRTLFFDTERLTAWTIEVSILTTWNHAADLNRPVALNLIQPAGPPQANGTQLFNSVSYGNNGIPGVTIKSLNRTFANLGVGREYYLWGAAQSGGPNWRVGFDVGGRWGSEVATFSEIRHRVDTIAGLYLALHTDYEIPYGMFTFVAGFRAVIDYTWSDILQEQNNSDLWGVNLLLNFGVRY